MKALVLAGGKGSRLRPITHTFAKQLIPIANKPILFYGLEAISRAGISEVGIVIGDTGAEIREAVGDGSAFGLKVTYIPQAEPLGLAHAVKVSQKFLGDSPFLMFLGDNLLKEGLEKFVGEFVSGKPEAQILVTKVQNPQQFGVVEFQGDRVAKLTEKPKEPKSDLALVGVYLFTPKVFDAIATLKPSGRGELEITEAIQWLLDKGFKVSARATDGWWKDTGKLEDLLEANRLVLDGQEKSFHPSVQVDDRSKVEGRVVLEEGVKLFRTTIRGPAVIGKNTQLSKSFVGPYTSIYHDVQVEDSEIEHSIVLEGAKIKNITRIEDSLIGQRVEVVKSFAQPAAYRIMVGDSSRVEVP